MEFAVHLPLIEFADEDQSLARLTRTVDAARECGLAAISANDHFLFSTPWLDGPTALAAVLERSGDMALATTPLGDEPRQIELAATAVLPAVDAAQS